MGLENRAEGKYITIYNGKFCQRVDRGTEGGVERINKLGNTVFEKFYDKFTAKLVSIKINDGTYGKSWHFGFRDKGDLYILQLNYSNNFAQNLLKMLPNLDLSKEMTITPQVKEVDGKNKSSLFINQDNVSIKHAYTKDNPNGLPPMIEKIVKGQKIWDDTDRLEFLQKMVETEIIPKLEKIAPTPEYDLPSSEDKEEEINPDDVPF